MKPSEQASSAPHLVWVYWASLKSMNAATLLEPTRALRSLGWRVTLIAAGPSGYQQIQGVEVFCIPRPDVYFFWQFPFHLKLILFLLRHWPDIDLLFFHQMSAPWLFPLRIVRALTGRPRPLLVMDTRTVPMAEKSKETVKEKLWGSFHTIMTRAAKYFVDGQTAITPRMAEAVAIPPRQLWGVWPSGVNPAHFVEVGGSRRWPAGNEAVSLVYVGTLNHERNLMTLCRAVEAANNEGLKFTLTLVGSGTAQADLEHFAAQSEQRVKVLPEVPYDQVPQILANGHVGTLPFPDEDKYRVSSPIKLFEYMAAGMPVLATRIVCHTDVVRDAPFTFWAESATVSGFVQALCQIWDQRASLAERSSEAATAAQEWTWEASARKLKSALERGLASAPTAVRKTQAPLSRRRAVDGVVQRS